MNLMPMGDYYLWYCEWCDSSNRTIWTRFETNNVHCSFCQRPVLVPDWSQAPQNGRKPSYRYTLR